MRVRDSDCEKYNCDYPLPHYHCAAPECGLRILKGDGDRREGYHPCCSPGCLRKYHRANFCGSCRKPLRQKYAVCLNCGFDNKPVAPPEPRKPSPVTDLAKYASEHPRWMKKRKSPKR